MSAAPTGGAIPGRIGQVVLVIVTLGLVAGCGQVIPGSATAAAPDSSRLPRTAGTHRPTATTTSTSRAVDSPLAGVDPCALVATAESAGMGFPKPGQREDLAGMLRCVWADAERSFRIVLDPYLGLEETNNGQATSVEPITLGRHQGRRVVESSGQGYCEYDIKVTDHAHATAAALNLDSTADACNLATQAAAILEPRLP